MILSSPLFMHEFFGSYQTVETKVGQVTKAVTDAPM